MDPAISVSHLTYRHQPDTDPSLDDVSLSLPRGSRTIIVGANGAGKSTLLQILAGKRLVSTEGAHIFVQGRDVFRDSPPGVAFLGTEWAMNPVVRGDIVVSAFLDSVGGYRHKERRDRLLDILDVDLDWHMHQISDGERRRVQLCFGLMVPWDVLLLDEVTVDLDVLVRDDLLKFLKTDSEQRGATILCNQPLLHLTSSAKMKYGLDATHIFDGLNNFPTHVTHMRLGSVIEPPASWPISSVSSLTSQFAPSTPLYAVALQWLKEDRDNRQELERNGRKRRGARREQVLPTESEAFYKNMNQSSSIQPEIIDLTRPEYSGVDVDVASTKPTNSITSEQEKKRPRKRKKKRTEGESTPSVAPTREASPEEGEIESKKRRDNAHDDSDVLLDGVTGHHKERRLNDKRKTLSSPLLASPRPKDTKRENLFFIDLEPLSLPAASQFASTSTVTLEKTTELLLPAHVSVFGEEPAEIMAPDNADSDEEFIDYLDLDDNSKNIVRYFEDPLPESSKPSRTVCKNCGAEGKHTTATCPVMITCPNRKAARRGELDRYDDCDRCGSKRHKTNECPTSWRLYEYLTEEAKSLVLRTRREKQNFALGEGGEGYIADDEWCYNCGAFGHWGDDCEDVPHREDVPDEYSAFSEHNTLSGPFFDSVTERSALKTRRHERRDRDPYYGLPPSWGNVPDNVGKKGRRDNTAKMERRAQEQAIEDDPDDWFGNPQNARSRGIARNNSDRKSNLPKKLTFGKSLQESTRHFRPPSPPKLLNRIGDVYYTGQSRSERRSSRDTGPPRKPNRDHKRDDRHEHDSDWRRRNDAGPRYKGGYSR
ncbi:hypothetical protein C0995_014502 [Termitomyces sp. Mi166|nr:hypothetical protein C0995_014502 [Termitomyces sp. Mi166\